MKHYERINNLMKLIEKYNELRALSGNYCKDVFEAIDALRQITPITDDEVDEICARMD